MTGGKIARMFHVMVTPLCSRHHLHVVVGWRQINVSNFTFLSADPADQHPSSLPAPEPRERGGRKGSGVTSYSGQSLSHPFVPFSLSCILGRSVPVHASRVPEYFMADEHRSCDT